MGVESRDETDRAQVDGAPKVGVPGKERRLRLDPTMPSLLDREINTDAHDAFGHRHFASALRSLIESPGNEPPFSIGLLGGWGSGKSSIKALYQSSLAGDRMRSPNGTIRSDQFRAVTFNAWRFGGENMKRALLRHVFLELGGEERDLTDALFSQITRNEDEQRNWAQIKQEVVERFVWSPLQILLLLVVGMLIVGGAAWLLGLGSRETTALLGAFILAGIPTAVAALSKYSPIRLLSPMTRVSLPSTSAEQYEALLVQQLTRFKKGGTTSVDGRRCERLIIFVDDLDRLSAEEMVNGLDAIRTFMEISGTHMPPGLGIVFVISCDEDRVATALADRRHRIGGDVPGTVFNRTDARRYLDRIFQFRLEIPPFPRQDMRKYALQRLANEAPSIRESVITQGVALEDVLDRMIHVGVQSPRSAVQILNAFCASWWLAMLRERDGAGTNRAGGLYEGAVTRYPEVLAALCALRVDFPDFYNDLQVEPKFITYFARIFIQDSSFDDIPDRAREMLRRYKQKDSDDLQQEHWPLRQNLASIQDLNMPPLQPLLLLSQDAASRQYGEDGARLLDAFVSGDTNGVLVALGRDRTNDKLSDRDVRRFRDMLDELAHETVSRRNNAVYVLAALVERLPSASASLAVTPAARYLSGSPPLRWRLGIERIGRLLVTVRSDLRREVAGHLIRDCLRVEGDIVFRLPTGQAPSLGEATEMATAACAIALRVFREDGLDGDDEQTLLNWLELRRVAANGEEYAFPFPTLEKWMTDFEIVLLPAMAGRYTRLVADELARKPSDAEDDAAMIRRSHAVFESLWESGQDSRSELWEQLTRYIALPSAAAVELAAATMVAHQHSPPADALVQFLSQFARRLTSDSRGADKALPQVELGSRFLDVIETRSGDIEQGVDDDLFVALATDWSDSDITAALAVRLIALMDPVSPEAHAAIIADWTERLFTDLADPCSDWLASHVPIALDDEEQQAVADALTEVVGQASLTKEEGRRYRTFIGHLPDQSIRSDIITAHLQQVLTLSAQRYTDLNFLTEVFPVLPPRLHAMNPDVMGPQLQSLFANGRTQPAVHAWLLGQLTGHWPSADAGYNPDQIFQYGISLIVQYPSDDETPPALESLADMVTRGVVGRSRETDLANAALSAWPTYPATAIKVWRVCETIPTAAEIADLAEPLGTQTIEFPERLRDAWEFFAEKLSDNGLSQVLVAILEGDASGPAEEPDQPLRLWCDAIGVSRGGLLLRCVLDTELNDAQRRRVWLQIVQRASSLGPQFFLDALPRILAQAETPATTSEVLTSREHIMPLFPDKSEQYQLGQALLRSLAAATTIETKNRLTEWIGDLGGGILAGLSGIEGLTREDVDLLQGRYKDSRNIARWLKEHEHDE